MKYRLLSEILPLLDRYEEGAGNQAGLKGFSAFLSRHIQIENNGETLPLNPDERVDVARLFIFLTRYARGYGRKALNGTPLSNLDEFSYLIVLSYKPGLTKTGLIQENRHEKPTGMEIIRRLMAAGYIEQTVDVADRRNKRLKLTQHGQDVVSSVENRMQQVVDLLPGNLDPAEQRVLLSILFKLEAFHADLLDQTKNGGFEEVLEAANHLKK